MYTGGHAYHSAEFSCKGVADRSGSGDCFMAGLIYGFYNKHKPEELLNYATAAAFGKLQEMGDATGQDVLTVSKIEKDNRWIVNSELWMINQCCLVKLRGSFVFIDKSL